MNGVAPRSAVRTILVLGTLLPVVAGSACAPQSGGGPTAALLTTGEAAAPLVNTMPVEGGTFEIVDPGSPIHGLTIEVLAGAYSTAKEFTVSYRPILSHALPGGGEPASPLISIDNGGQYADEIMVVTIPISAAEDQVVTAFLYDDEHNVLEGLTVLDRDATSIKVAARHFSDYVAIGWSVQDLTDRRIDTGFTPGEDDWQFANEGSYLSPGGYCCGMNLTAMYYYIERRRNGHPQLSGRFDSYSLGTDRTTPGFTNDDDQGIKLCSIVQENIHTEVQRQFTNLRFWFGRPPTHDEIQFYSTVAAFVATREPQYLTIRRDDGSFHGLICFMVDGDRLYVADPDMPGGTRIIAFDRAWGIFDAARSTVSFDLLTYVGKTGVYNWARIGEWFNRTDSGEVSLEPNGFPEIEYKVIELDEDDNVVSSSYVDRATANDHNVSRPRVQVSVEVPTDFNKRVTAYRYASPPERLSSPYLFDLAEGDNLLGFHVEGYAGWGELGPSGSPVPANGWRWAGFQWINLYYTSQAQPGGGECTRDDVAGTWRRTYDYECDGVDDYTDDDSAVWILNADGTMSQGALQWGWGISGDDFEVWYPMDMDMSDSATLTEDCSRMEDGTTFYYSVAGGVNSVTCWTAARE